MKVKVTHTVKFEEVPALIEGILSDCREELRDASKFKFNLFDIEGTTEEVAALKDTLDLVASKLDDCLNLGQGYVSNLKLEPEETTEDPEREEDA